MYFVGIDGGGTKTKAVIMDEQGNILGIGTGGPSSIDTVSIDKTFESVKNAIDEARKDISDFHIDSIFLGLGGVVTDDHSKMVSEYFMKHLSYISERTVIDTKNDVYNAFSGGLPLDDEGIIIIIGTGSVAFGVKGELSHRAGGYGYQEGEPGSAYDLGRQVIKLVSKELDNRHLKSDFITEVKNEFNIVSTSDFITWSENLFEDRTSTAQLAKYVTKYAKLGDSKALKIIDESTDELRLMVEAVYNKLKLNNKKLAVIGSLGNDELFFKHFSNKIKEISNKFIIMPAMLEPVYGSGIKALKQAGVVIDESKISEYRGD